jgi:8-oxo-dGTP pyrophosphatase MutT (NUDIX family)
LVQGEYGNLWVRLHKNASFSALCQGKTIKALKYLFPLLIETARMHNQSYVVVESDCHSKVPERARLAGMAPRYMNTESGCQVNAIRLKEGPDRWPKFRAIKESVTSVILLINKNGQVFVVLGKNKDNGAGRGKNLGTLTGYREPGESAEEAVRREVKEETGLHISETVAIPLVAETHKQDYYPGADDHNETRAVCLHLAEGLEKSFELKQLEDKSWTLIQHRTVLKEEGEKTVSQEIKAADDLAQVYVLPIEEALVKLNAKSSGLAKVQAAYKAVSEGRFFQQKLVSFGWSSQLQSYDDVVFTSAST